MYVEVITPASKVFEGDALAVQVPGMSGSFDVLPGHAAIVSALGNGRLRVRTKEKELVYTMQGGVIEVLKDKVVVLAETITA